MEVIQLDTAQWSVRYKHSFVHDNNVNEFNVIIYRHQKSDDSVEVNAFDDISSKNLVTVRIALSLEEQTGLLSY